MNPDKLAPYLILAVLLATFAYLCYQRGRMVGFARGCRNEREFAAKQRIKRSRQRVFRHGRC